MCGWVYRVGLLLERVSCRGNRLKNLRLGASAGVIKGLASGGDVPRVPNPSARKGFVMSIFLVVQGYLEKILDRS